MARVEKILTDSYQQVAAGAMVLTIKEGIGKPLTYNDANSAVAEAVTVATDKTQILQNEGKPTWAKGAGITVIIDEV